MTQGLVGADIVGLRSLAKQFEVEAETLKSAAMTVTRGVEAQFWIGPVALRFKTTWTQEHVLRLDSAVQTLRTAAEALRRNADQQETTSKADGAVASGSSGSAAPRMEAKPGTGNQGSSSTASTDPEWGSLEAERARNAARMGYSVAEDLDKTDTLKWARRGYELGSSGSGSEFVSNVGSYAQDDLLDHLDEHSGGTTKVVMKTIKSYVSLGDAIREEINDPANAGTDYSATGILGSIGYGITHPGVFVDSIVEGIQRNPHHIYNYVSPWLPWNWFK
jgi:hypothetical protein